MVECLRKHRPFPLATHITGVRTEWIKLGLHCSFFCIWIRVQWKEKRKLVVGIIFLNSEEQRSSMDGNPKTPSPCFSLVPPGWSHLSNTPKSHVKPGKVRICSEASGITVSPVTLPSSLPSSHLSLYLLCSRLTLHPSWLEPWPSSPILVLFLLRAQLVSCLRVPSHEGTAQLCSICVVVSEVTAKHFCSQSFFLTSIHSDFFRYQPPNQFLISVF